MNVMDTISSRFLRVTAVLAALLLLTGCVNPSGAGRDRYEVREAESDAGGALAAAERVLRAQGYTTVRTALGVEGARAVVVTPGMRVVGVAMGVVVGAYSVGGTLTGMGSVRGEAEAGRAAGAMIRGDRGESEGWGMIVSAASLEEGRCVLRATPMIDRTLYIHSGRLGEFWKAMEEELVLSRAGPESAAAVPQVEFR